MKGQRIGYVRVSTFDQNVDRQLDGQSLDRIFTDKASGKDINRPELDALLAFARAAECPVALRQHAWEWSDRCGIVYDWAASPSRARL